MAGRTSAGVGVGVAITVLAVLCAALFVLTMVFYSQRQAAELEIAGLSERNDMFIKDNERQLPNVQEAVTKAGRESLVTYLMNTQRQMMRTASGRPDMSVEDFEQQATGDNGVLAQGESLLGKLRTLNGQIGDLQRRVADAEAARAQAQQDAQAEASRVQAIEKSARESTQQLEADIGEYQRLIQEYRRNVDRLEGQMREQLDRQTADSQQRQDELSDSLAVAQQTILLLKDQIKRLRGESDDALKPKDEYALVDGQIIEIRPVASEVVISLGRKDHVVLGQTFSVYRDAAALSPSLETGEYSEGKAVIEVVDIDQDTSRARIVRESRGNPIVRGDVIANPVYDPNKIYRFLVYGNFDTNRDGIASKEEASDLEALIRDWGGVIENDLTGGIDFLVLGQKPVLPPQPSPDAPWEVLQEYVRLQRIVSRYDELFAQSISSSIPVLNENRLMTLLGSIPD